MFYTVFFAMMFDFSNYPVMVHHTPGIRDEGFCASSDGRPIYQQISNDFVASCT